MFTDIVGYTALMGKDEKKAFDLLKKNRDLQRPIIEQYNGRWIKELGDGVMASFKTVSDAVNAALKIQEACNTAKDFQLRIGIHLGEVVFENDDVFGDGVNIASRIQTIAEPGKIYISESVHNNISNKQGIETKFVKQETLKNVKEPVRIYEVIIPGEPSRSTITKQPVKSSEKSIAVLPFVNMSNDPEQEYFSDGIAEEILIYLSRVPGLKVAARTSSFFFKNKNEDLNQIGRQLHVNLVLEGSVRKYQDMVRITVQLISIEDGFHIWSEKYDRKIENLFAIQEEIAESITGKLKLTLSTRRQLENINRPTNNLEAYEHYLKGNYYLYRFKLDDAIKAYEKAIKDDEGFANAYAMLGKVYLILSALIYLPPQEGYGKAWELGNKAIHLDAEQTDGYNTLGLVSILHKWNLPAARNYFETALKIDPFYAYGHIGLAWYYCAMQEFHKSEEFGRSASRLDPLNQDILIQKGIHQIYSRQFEAAKETAYRMIEIDPSVSEGHRLLGWACWGNKDYDHALQSDQKAFELNPSSGWAKHQLAMSLAKTGKKAEAKKLLQEMLDRASANWWSPDSIAWVYAALDDIEQTLYWLEKAFDERSFYFLFMFEPCWWDMLRDDPHFEGLQKKVDALKVV